MNEKNGTGQPWFIYKNAYILIFKESTIDIMVDLMLHDLMGGQVRKCLVKIQIANC